MKKGTKSKNAAPNLAILPEAVRSTVSPCLALVPDHKLKQADAPCIMGGMPPLPAHTHWPERDGKLLLYLGCINTDAAHTLMADIPAAGWLLFFCDPEAEVTQTLIQTHKPGKPVAPPADSEYITSFFGPDDGEVAETQAYQLVPAWSWTYPSDTMEEWSDEVNDELERMMPENAAGHLLGSPHDELGNYERDRAVIIAAGHGAARLEDELGSHARSIQERKTHEMEGSESPAFALPTFGKRLHLLMQELQTGRADWKRRAEAEGKSWPEDFTSLSEKFFVQQGRTVQRMSSGIALDVGDFVTVTTAWMKVVKLVEGFAHDRKHAYLYEWSREWLKRQQQAESIAASGKASQTPPGEDLSEMMRGLLGDEITDQLEAFVESSGVRKKIHLPILEALLQADQRRKDRLAALAQAMSSLDDIGNSIAIADAAHVFQHAARVLHNHFCDEPGPAAPATDLLTAYRKWKSTVNLDAEGKRWRLLFVFRSELGFVWNDSGSIRFFIEADRLAEGRFDRVVSDISSS